MAKTVFVDGDPSQGVQGTIVDAAFLNLIFQHRHDGADQDGSAPINFAVDTGAANAYAIALTPALAAHVEGMPIYAKILNSNNGASTLAINALPAVAIKNPDGTDVRQGQLTAGGIGAFVYDGAYYQLVSVANGESVGISYSFDAAAPPANPINLNVRDRLTITFENVTSIPLNCACGQGLYKVSLAMTNSNSANNDLFWSPNDQTYAATAFSSWGIEDTDQGISASPYVGSAPVTSSNYKNQSCFYFDYFFGPNSPDTINDIGPTLTEFLVSTFTAAKMIKGSAGITGGPAIFFGIWNDTATAWTSLGTLTLLPSTTLFGVIVIERIA